MIERYSIGATAKQLAEQFEVEEPTGFTSRYNAAPSQLLPVITQGIPRGFSFFYWGQPPGWSKNKTLAERIINIRKEQVDEKPVLKKSLIAQRCIIPADGFYAWKRVGKKTLIPWRFSMKNKSFFSIAGVWEEYDDEENNSFHTFTILTTQANPFVMAVSERMPLVLTKEEEKIWTDAKPLEDDFLKSVLSVSADQLDGFAVSPQLNTISFDRPSLILPVPPADQFGNLTLFD